MLRETRAHIVPVLTALLVLLSPSVRASSDCATIEEVFDAVEGDMLSLVRWDILKAGPYTDWSQHDRLSTSASGTVPARVATSFTGLGDASVQYFFLNEAPWGFPAGSLLFVQSANGSQEFATRKYQEALRLAEGCLPEWDRQVATAKGYYGVSKSDTLDRGVAFTREGTPFHVEVRLSRFGESYFHAKLMVVRLGDGAPRPSEIYESPVLRAARGSGASSAPTGGPADFCNSLSSAILAARESFTGIRGELTDSFMGKTYRSQVTFPGAISVSLESGIRSSLRLQALFYDGLDPAEAESRQRALEEQVGACQKPCSQWVRGRVAQSSVTGVLWIVAASSDTCSAGLKVEAIRRSVPNVEDAGTAGAIRDRWYVELGVRQPGE